MSVTKKSSQDKWLAILLSVNLILITAIVLTHMDMPQAQAQRRSRSLGGEYMLVPGQFKGDSQIVWIMDMRSALLTSCLVDKSRLDVQAGEVLDMSGQFPAR